MIFSKSTKKRLKIFSLIAIAASVIFFFIYNFRSNIVFFYSPSELSDLKISSNKIIRVGGLVKENSVKSSNNILEFVITDYKDDLKITYSGIKPDLFREKQGIVAKGVWNKQEKIFIASEILAKHDENYMPPEVSKAIQKNIQYKENH